MKLLTFRHEGGLRPGVLDGDDVVDLAAAGLPVDGRGDLAALVEAGESALDRVRAAVKAADARRYPLSKVEVAAPIQAPPKVIAVGLNYIDHCREADLAVPEAPVLFTKWPTSVAGPYDEVSWSSSLSAQVDFEGEMGVVVGKRARNVSVAEAMDYVFGYTVVNDVSARDLQFAGAKQWDRGKSPDTFCPYGPYIVTRDEIPDPHVLDIRTVVNGEQMQSSNTRNLIFDVPKIISFISEASTLLPGDLIPTGTPFGVGFTRKPPYFFKDGDECMVEIEKIGAIRNRMRVTGG